MKSALSCSLLAIFLALTPTRGLAVSLSLQDYQEAEGAITVKPGGRDVDPYFATKALLIAQDLGLDIHVPAAAWIDWLIARQSTDGSFDRFCLEPDDAWKVCREADADDALLVLWLELLHRSHPTRLQQSSWRDSIVRSRSMLDALHDPERGVYRVHREIPVALFMDNIEIYDALRNMAALGRKGIISNKAKHPQREIRFLRTGIVKTFWDPSTQRFHASTQSRTETLFYPDIVAQLYPIMAGLPYPRNSMQWHYRRWMAHYGQEWLTMKSDYYPWGLVAVVAWRMGDFETARRWWMNAHSLRGSDRWNVLEEAIFQGLGSALDFSENPEGTAG